MSRLIARLTHGDEGQDLIEYALLSALLAVACISAILQLSRIREFFAAAGAALAGGAQ